MKNEWRKFKYKNHNTQIIYIYIYTPRNKSCITTYFLYQKASKLEEQDMQDTAGGIRTNS